MDDTRSFRCFDVMVTGYGTAQFLAKSRGQALADAWRSSAFDGWSFKDFLKRARARLSEPAADHYVSLRQSYPKSCIPPAGTRITAEGHTGIVLPAISPCSYVSFKDEETGARVNVHPAGVRLAPTQKGHLDD
jgi:hypothetical protein